jgi:phosphatidylglycerophosphatase A
MSLPIHPPLSAPLAQAQVGASVLLMPAFKPSWGWMCAHPARLLALGFGAGLARWAPGTVGTLWAWVVFSWLQPYFNDWQWGTCIVLGFALGCWACTRTGQHMQEPDSGHMVWDEVVAFWLVLWMAQPTGFFGQLGLFLVFRFFDAVKLGPVRWADQHFKGLGWRGGFGVMFDDLVAAACTLLLLAWWRF